MSADKTVRIEQAVIERLLENNDVEIIKEEVIHVERNGQRIVSIYPDSKYAEFEEDFRDHFSHVPAFIPLIAYLQSKEYNTNLK